MTFLLKLLGFDQGADVHRVAGGDFHYRHFLPPWVLYGVLVLGLLLAGINFLPWLRLRLSTRIATCLLRLAAVLVLLVIISGLEWHVSLEVNEKPRWTVLVDDSASMAVRDVGGQSRYAAALSDLEKIRSSTAGKVELTEVPLSGSGKVESEPGQGPTLFQDAISRTALSRGQVDRLIVLTDGRDSEGRDLQRLGEDLLARDIRLAVALYGLDTPPKVMGITAEPERNVIRLGEELVVRGTLTGQPATGDETITLKENNQAVKTIPAPPRTERRFEIQYKPKKKGQHVYTVELSAPDVLPQNNKVRFTVNVIEEKINVLLLDGYPRFEFKFFKLALEVDPLVKLVSVAHIPGGGVHVQGEPLHRNPQEGLLSSPAELFKYDVVILRDVPRRYFRAGGDTTESRLQAIVQFVTKRGGGLLVTGGQDVHRSGGYGDSALAEILPFDLSNRISGQDQFDGLFYVQIPKTAYEHPLLQLLPNPAENRDRLNSLRQLDGSNNVGAFKPLATPLMTRLVKVKGKGETLVEKEAPIMGYLAVGDGKVLATAVDTMWRWQLQPDFDDPPFAMLLANAVRFLAPPPGRKPGQPNVTLSNPTPQVGQDLELATDLRDSNYDPIQAADLMVTVTRPDGGLTRMYPRDLPEEPGHYAYRVHLEQPGAYKVTAKFGKFESTREFVAGAAAGEFADLSIDRVGMTRLTRAAEGEMINTVDGWLNTVNMQPTRKTVLHELEVWNSPLVLLAFFLLICTDCYLRKRQGLA